MMRALANIITGSRIVFSILMLFFPALSPWFYAMHLLCGLTDMVDGTIARKTNSVSEFGVKLDSIADFVFFGAAFVKLLPVMSIPTWLWVWILVIAFIKAVNVISGFVRMRRLIVQHTVMNKVTGALLFLLPLTLSFVDMRGSAAVVCIFATFAAIQEGHFTRMEREIV